MVPPYAGQMEALPDSLSCTHTCCRNTSLVHSLPGFVCLVLDARLLTQHLLVTQFALLCMCVLTVGLVPFVSMHMSVFTLVATKQLVVCEV